MGVREEHGGVHVDGGVGAMTGIGLHGSGRVDGPSYHKPAWSLQHVVYN